MASVIRNRIAGVFIPVRDIQSAKEWYCNLLGLEPSGEILHGHLYILPMENALNVILDSKIFSEEKVFQIPAFQFDAECIEEAYSYMLEKNVNVVTEIQHNQWFNFKDPDGNLLMVCKCA